jgi:hypothetical protein
LVERLGYFDVVNTKIRERPNDHACRTINRPHWLPMLRTDRWQLLTLLRRSDLAARAIDTTARLIPPLTFVRLRVPQQRQRT